MHGIKETKDKLFYELDWSFIELMAKRMSDNKGEKYPKFNWHKPIDIDELKSAMARHFIEVQKGNYHDNGEYGHITALACNAMMLIYQLREHHEDIPF